MTYEEFKQNFLGDFLNIKSFAGRMKYAGENLTRIGSGSGRVVYDIDGERVLKLAKNPKGVAQNEAEAGAGRYEDTHSIVTKVFEEADDNTWLISEKGKKVTERRIKELTGIPSLNDLYMYLRNFTSSNNGRGNVFGQDRQIVDFLNENEFAQELQNFVANYSQSSGDMGRTSSYGEVLRDGQPTIVLTDYGLNDEVYDTHYSPTRKKQYAMYEMYNCADGNDDMLSDINSGEQVRRGMWALMPQGVGDGDEPMNEEFISYVENRNKYPDKRLPNLPFLTDRFHECVNNLKETLNVVKNKKQFYNNLLELQDYLIAQNYYDREPLNHEEYVINEMEVPAVQMYTLEDKNYSAELATMLAEKLQLPTPKFIGGGANGFAYEINPELVMKLTADVSEADAASNLLRGRPKYIAQVYNLYKIVDTETNMAYYAIMEENIDDKPLEKFRKMGNDLEKISTDGEGLNNFYRLMKNFKTFDYDAVVEQAKEILTENPEAGVSQIERQEAYDYVIGLLNIRKELIEFNIKSTDYVEIKNLGYKNGVLKFFDFGGRMGGTEPEMDGKDIIYLPEDGTSKFSTADSIGRDDFPVYDNNDTSPLTDNNVPTSIDELVERVLSSMKGSSTVSVKKKCKLGGQGNTSAACNQGDINNLDIKPLDEKLEVNIPTNLSGYDSINIVNDGQVVGEFGIIDRGVHDGNHYIAIDKIFINKNFRGKGYANDAMKIMFEYADKNNIIVTLTPDNVWGASVPKLKAWYKSLGFVMNTGKNKDFQTMQLMYRLPNTNTRLNEVGEGNVEPYPIAIERSDSIHKIYTFTTEDSDKYYVEFDSAGDTNDDGVGGLWATDFGIKNDTDNFNFTQVTNKGRIYRIMATLVKLMKGFLANTKPDTLVIEPTKTKNIEDRRRFSLYLQFIKKHLPLDYEYTEDSKEILIKKKANNLNEAELISLQDLPFKQEVEQLGGKIFSVGGAVRDGFLGKDSKDLDLLISGIPIDELKNVLQKYGRASIEGESFAVIIFTPKGSTESIDIAVPRTEKPTGGGGHKDFKVTADHTLPIEKDLERRDFTINAIAKDVNGNIIDPYNGQEDLKNKIIRAVNPEAFSDDPLRMLRAVQFASRFGFTIEPQTMQMIIDSAQMIKKEPSERILTEFGKIVTKGNPRIGAQLLKDTGLYSQMFGTDLKQSIIDRSPFEDVKTIGEFVFLLIRLFPNPSEYYLQRFATEEAKRDRKYKEIIALSIAYDNAEETNPIKARTVAHNMYVTFPQSLQSQILPSSVEVAAQELLQGKYPKTVNELAVNGNDLMELGLQGKAIGDMQKSLLMKIYGDKVGNNREELLALAGQKKSLLPEALIYQKLNPEHRDSWSVNGQNYDIHYFLDRYDEWNAGDRFRDPSKESILRFMEDEFEQFVDDEKLRREMLFQLNLRDLLNESVEMNNIAYSAVVLDEESKQKLIKVFKPMIPEGWEIIAHHMTLNMGAIDPKYVQDLNKEILLTVVDYAIDEKVMAVGVTGYQTNNAKAHITLAVNRQDGGKPMMSNNLKTWTAITFPLELKGIVTQVRR